jgi:hypothetical protein
MWFTFFNNLGFTSVPEVKNATASQRVNSDEEILELRDGVKPIDGQASP